MLFEGSVFWFGLVEQRLKEVCYTLQNQKTQLINRADGMDNLNIHIYIMHFMIQYPLKN